MTNVPNSFDNQDFRRELGEMFDDKLSPIVTLQSRQQELLEKHERDITRGKTAWSLISGLFVALLGAFGVHVSRH